MPDGLRTVEAVTTLLVLFVGVPALALVLTGILMGVLDVSESTIEIVGHGVAYGIIAWWCIVVWEIVHS